jgi:hypothetical protein
MQFAFRQTYVLESDSVQPPADCVLRLADCVLRLAGVCRRVSVRQVRRRHHRQQRDQRDGAGVSAPGAAPGIIGSSAISATARVSVRQVQRQHHQQLRDQRHGDERQCHAVPVVVMHPCPRCCADRAAALGHRPGTLSADQVLAAHLAPSGQRLPGHFDDVARSKTVSPLDCPMAKLGRGKRQGSQSVTR